MSGSETTANENAMGGGNLGTQNDLPAESPEPLTFTYRAADGTTVYGAFSGSFPAAHPSGMGLVAQPKKRGRPRKYPLDGTPPVSSAFTSPPGAQPTPRLRPPKGTLRVPRPMGRAAVSGSDDIEQPLRTFTEEYGDLGLPANGCTPHVITVQDGEDVAFEIFSFCLNSGPICVLSANGALSDLTLRQKDSSDVSVKHKGDFEILELTGRFKLSNCSGNLTMIGGLNVAVAGPDGHVLGGGVAGRLAAASPIQVIVGSYPKNGKKESNMEKPKEPMSAPPRRRKPRKAAAGPSSPLALATPMESCGVSLSPLNQTVAADNSTPSSVPDQPSKENLLLSAVF